MNTKPGLNLKSVIAKLTSLGKQIQPYSLLVFLLFVALLYGFVLLRINSLGNAQTHIDQTVVNQLQSLQDNSVSVQTLFNQARNNPFQ